MKNETETFRVDMKRNLTCKKKEKCKSNDTRENTRKLVKTEGYKKKKKRRRKKIHSFAYRGIE